MAEEKEKKSKEIDASSLKGVPTKKPNFVPFMVMAIVGVAVLIAGSILLNMGLALYNNGHPTVRPEEYMVYLVVGIVLSVVAQPLIGVGVPLWVVNGVRLNKWNAVHNPKK